MEKSVFKGYFTALVTPFTAKGKVDFVAYEALINRQIENGVAGLVPCGTTGEAPVLEPEEHLQLVKLCVQLSKGKVPVIAGAGNNNTARTIELVNKIADLGAAGVLLVTPYYNKPNQAGLYEHYKAIHNNTNINMILYNVPSRTNVDMSSDTVIKLSYLDRVVGLKDASGDLSRVSEILSAGVKPTFSLLSGNDDSAFAFMAAGGDGCVSVASNVVPALCCKMYNLLRNHNFAEALAMNNHLFPLFKVLFCETNPTPCKYALSSLGLCLANVRLPLCDLASVSKDKVDKVLQRVLKENG